MNTRQKNSFYRHPAFIVASALVVIFVLLELTNTTHILHKSSSETRKSTNPNTNQGEGSATKTPQGTTTPANTTT
jgi:UDP-N-acetylenolpyruvoylglucosamine reductase